MQKELLISNYELKRLLVLQAYMSDEKSVPKSLAYAYDKRIAPIHDISNRLLVEAYGLDPYDSIYVSDKNFVADVTAYLDQNWVSQKSNLLEFSTLQSKFCVGNVDKTQLAYVLRYIKLSGLFDENLFNSVAQKAPIEASSINEDYVQNEVYLG